LPQGAAFSKTITRLRAIVRLVMNAMKSRWLLLCGTGLLSASCGAMAQGGVAAGEMSAQADKVPTTPAMARSALWQAVDAQYRGQGASAESVRRLSAEQRVELREQVRRAAHPKAAALQPPELPAR